jgi:AAA15 family ATPase/GTPase
MSKHFIREIEIKNYKLFKDFKAEGFGRVNLIGGKNNVGKTALMEAIYISTAKKIFEIYQNFLTVKSHRYNLELVLKKSDPNSDLIKRIQENINFIFKTNHGQTSIYILDDKYEIKLQKNSYKKNFQEIYNLIQMQPFGNAQYGTSQDFLSSYFTIDGTLSVMIDELKLNNRYDELNQYISSFFNIQKIDIINGILYIKKDNQFRPIYEYGHGVKNLLNIIVALLFSQEKRYIFIDEIENGTHYTLFDELWKLILTLSKELNVQVFATTHSKECIESYARVAKKLDDKDITFVDLGLNRKNEMKALVMDSERFQREIKMDNEVRGW